MTHERDLTIPEVVPHPELKFIENLVYPPITIYPRSTAERYARYNPIIPERVLVAEMVDLNDMNETPRWKMGNGKDRYMSLPYCSGPPTAYLYSIPNPFFNVEINGSYDHGDL